MNNGEEDFPDYDDFVEHNDLGLPLAHLISQGIVESTPMAKEIIEETYSNLLEFMDEQNALSMGSDLPA
jgi:DNA transposition AAA+ family ATPase